LLVNIFLFHPFANSAGGSQRRLPRVTAVAIDADPNAVACATRNAKDVDVVEAVQNGTLWLFNIAMGNGPFIKNGDFPWLC
jgi:methylase of polypeptide subunit release factors